MTTAMTGAGLCRPKSRRCRCTSRTTAITLPARARSTTRASGATAIGMTTSPGRAAATRMTRHPAEANPARASRATRPTTASAASSSSRSIATTRTWWITSRSATSSRSSAAARQAVLPRLRPAQAAHAVGRAEEVLRHVPAGQDPAAEGAGERPGRRAARRRRDGQGPTAITPPFSSPAAGRTPCRATWPPSPSATRWSAG